MACISKRRDRWIIDFYDNQGKRRWETLPKGTTKGKAKEALRKIEDQLEKGNYIPNKKVPCFSEVAKEWLEFKKPNIRESTHNMYKGHLSYHFHNINNIKLNRITIAQVEKFIATKQSHNMNLTTLRKIIVTFNQVMNYSVRHKYISYNPVRDAERPKGQGGLDKSVIRVLTPLEINELLSTVRNQKYRTLLMLAIMSGARQGELFGLKWDDVDWINCQIHIQRSFNTGAWYNPKSKTSIRKIDLGSSIMTELKRWKIACPPSELDLIFPNNNGNPLDHGNMLSRHFYPALKKANLPKIRFHDLRHTYASLLIEQGENIKYIQTQLGHASPVVTLNVYAHLMNPVNREAANRLEKAVFGISGSKMVAETKNDLQRSP